jgi:hypothetical protein
MTDKFEKPLALLDDVARRISITAAYQRGQIAERARIVDWLNAFDAPDDFYSNVLADAIKAGEHLE